MKFCGSQGWNGIEHKRNNKVVMLKIYTGILILGMAVIISACDKSQSRMFPSMDKRAPGMLTEPVERDIGMRSIEVRAVYERGVQLTKDSEGFVRPVPLPKCSLADNPCQYRQSYRGPFPLFRKHIDIF